MASYRRFFAHDEVDRESAKHTLTGQPLPDDRSLAGDRGRVPVAALLI
jgi:transcriptional regulator of met regulon